MPDGQVVFEISADKTKAYAAIDDVTEALRKAGAKWEQDSKQSTSAIGDQFKATFAAITASGVAKKAAGILLDFGKASIEAASDLQEVQNVVDVTFGAGANKIEAWAKTAGTQFGLTELQAKQFTSTLGAMMKSSGLAGEEIIGMSTDLAGLAADMASFYNLDFDTAFQKIRAGISGEVEPLKQLGINMSVVNLEAYAMTHGITKAFDEMSQGEQTMLRYQYLMQATADAQGDFARTSGESFANMKRQLQTNLDTISASIGSYLIEPLKYATSAIAGFLSELTKEKPRTVLDEFADIKLNTENKLAEIENTAEQARLLLGVLEEINTNTGLSTDSNTLKYIRTLTTDIENLGAQTSKQGTITDEISSLAGGLNPTVQDGFKDAVDVLTGSIGDLKQAAGDTDAIEQNISDVAGAINELPGDTSKGAAIEAIADGANKLQLGQAVAWRSMYNVLKNIDGLSGIFNGGAAKNVSALATALSTDAPAKDKAAAWETFLNALGTNAGALNALTGQDAQGAADWLNAVKGALDDAKLDSQNVAAWAELLSVFAEGMSDENKGAFTDAIVDELLAMGSQSEYAREALAALGYESDDIADAQGQWLEMCKRLTETIPGLSTIINTQTGEVEGGAEAVRAYIDEWKNAETQMALLSAHQQKRTALESAFSDLPGLMLDAATAKYRMGKAEEEWRKYIAENKFSVGDTGQYRDAEGGIVRGKALEEIAALERAYKKAEDAYNAAQKLVDTRTEEYNAASAKYDEETQALISLYGETETAAKDAADSITILSKAADGNAESMQTVETAVKSAEEALKSLADYQERVREQTEQTVRSVVSGFEKIVTPGQRARNEVIRLTAQLGEASDEAKRAEIQKQLDAAKQTANSMATITSMTNDLMSQYNYMVDYKKLLDTARAKGVSEDILATLSDGSQQSYDYLYALANTGGNIDALNRMYDSVKAEAESFTNTLIDQKLAVDDTYESLVTQAQEAVGGLNLGDTAYANVSETLDAIVKACGDKSASIKSAVNGIVAQLNRLSSVGVSIGGWSPWVSAWRSYSSHANGIDYVPYDGYLAMLHQGERVQTAAEADLSRRYSFQQPSLDYNAIGGAIGANIQRGNVYLDGRVVGDVLSSRQANSYRAMERSGWQG